VIERGSPYTVSHKMLLKRLTAPAEFRNRTSFMVMVMMEIAVRPVIYPAGTNVKAATVITLRVL